MIISDKNRFIYSKTLKTASSSIEHYFYPFCNYVCPTDKNHYHGHLPAIQIKKMIGEKKWNNYFKFCSIRNPFDRAISAFYWFKYVNNLNEIGTLKKEKEMFEKWLIGGFLDIDDDVCAKYYSDKQCYTINEEFCMDDVIRYENMDIDLKRICNKLGIEWNPKKLLQLKSDIRPPGFDSFTLYTSSTRKIVEYISDYELNRFNYCFPKK